MTNGIADQINEIYGFLGDNDSELLLLRNDLTDLRKELQQLRDDIIGLADRIEHHHPTGEDTT